MSTPGPDTPDETPEEPSEEELIAEFTAWVQAIIHDVESVPDDSETRYWCPQWWAHPEAVTRLRALHQEYIKAEEDNALSGWFVYHWDAHTRTLFSPTGPFETCRYGHRFFEKSNVYTPRLMTDTPPADWAP
ncbi:DUF4913 domain-containing protein [Arthrobacter sp. NyZ413]|uniref:DUF4913 domain-containing protein n=1 Tax=Arthrobacter sp. NyZ413 TaxID=3144669 RepID=UPI003BF7ACDE